MQYDDSYKCAIFPFPTNEDFMLDSIIATAESKEGDLEQADPSGDGRSAKSSSAPHFIAPGGTAESYLVRKGRTADSAPQNEEWALGP